MDDGHKGVIDIIIIGPSAASIFGEGGLDMRAEKQTTSPRKICWLWLSGVPALLYPPTNWCCLGSFLRCCPTTLHQRLLCRVTQSNYTVFWHLIGARGDSCRSTRPFDLASYVVTGFVPAPQVGDSEEHCQAFVLKFIDPFVLSLPGVLLIIGLNLLLITDSFYYSVSIFYK